MLCKPDWTSPREPLPMYVEFEPPFSFENGAKLILFFLAFTMLCCENEAFRKLKWKCIILKTVCFDNDPFS